MRADPPLCSLRYASYWRRRFQEQPLTDFCSVIKTNSQGPVGESRCEENMWHFSSVPLKLSFLF